MSSLEEKFRTTFDDRSFSRAERQALRKIMKEEALMPRELGVLRAKIFDIARDNLQSLKAEQVVDWLEEANKLVLPSKKPRFSNRVFFSPGEDCLNAILSLIQNSRDKLDICVFTISDNRISREIENCFRRKVRVRILTDVPKLHDKGSDIHRLAMSGIPVRIDDSETHMHHKFAVADDKQVLTGSYNWTRSAARANEENILITDDPNTIQAFQKEFNRLWEMMNVFEAR